MNDNLNTDLNAGPNTDLVTGLELVGCPACGAPAEVVERFVLDSTEGPIEHATVRCADRHRFTVLVERLTSGQPQQKGPGRWASR
jgi:hypothetical protein